MVTGSVSSKDNTAAFKDLMKIIRKTKVLVGITEETSTREHSGSINNAELLFIHSNGVRAPSMRTDMQPDLDAGKKYSKAYALYIQSHGSPLWQSPPRPVLEPSIEANKEKISAKLKTAYKAVLSGGSDYRDKYEAAGLFAQNKARDWFVDSRNGWAPNAPRTIERKGSDRPLIDTGEMRKSITYIVRD
jgi:hypothetical protein